MIFVIIDSGIVDILLKMSYICTIVEYADMHMYIYDFYDGSATAVVEERSPMRKISNCRIFQSFQDIAWKYIFNVHVSLNKKKNFPKYWPFLLGHAVYFMKGSKIISVRSCNK